MVTLPETELQIKTHPSDRLGNVGTEVEKEPPSGSIMIQIGLSGSYSVQILANQSDEADQLIERLIAARSLLELLQKVFTTYPLSGTEGVR